MNGAALDAATRAETQRAWRALWALIIGFFVATVDATIVPIANPAIKAALEPHTANLDSVVWVTSAYLLTYAASLLISGALGDHFGQKRVYVVGLSLFTLASLCAGLSPTLELLIASRAVQGVGGALMSPQTMAVIAMLFPAEKRGAAMGLWGSVSGIALLVGPLAGGLLVDTLGWEWIFFVNVPIGIVGIVLAWRLVPRLETNPHRFDRIGVALSALALLLIVFGLQEAQAYDWGVIWGPVSVWAVIAAGVVLLSAFVWHETRTRAEPLVPLGLFRDRNFSIANIGITAVGFTVTSMSLPIVYFLQLSRGLSPTQSALFIIPMALFSGVLGTPVGRLIDRVDPRVLLVPALLLMSASLALYAVLMSVEASMWMLLIPSAIMGVGNAGIWGPMGVVATRALPRHHAGAGAATYRATRTVGSVLGSAALAAFMQGRIEAVVPHAQDALDFSSATLPAAQAQPFADAMAQSLLLPAAVLLIALVAVFFVRPPVPR